MYVLHWMNLVISVYGIEVIFLGEILYHLITTSPFPKHEMKYARDKKTSSLSWFLILYHNTTLKNSIHQKCIPFQRSCSSSLKRQLKQLQEKGLRAKCKYREKVVNFSHEFYVKSIWSLKYRFFSFEYIFWYANSISYKQENLFREIEGNAP